MELRFEDGSTRREAIVMTAAVETVHLCDGATTAGVVLDPDTSMLLEAEIT